MDLVSPNDALLRLAWYSKGVSKDRDGTLKIKGAGFSRSELLGYPDDSGLRQFVSVDLKRIVDKLSIDWRIESQTSNGKAKEYSRFTPYFAETVCSNITGAVDMEGNPIFEVGYLPLEAGADGEGSPANPAHCGLLPLAEVPATEEECKARVEELRAKLQGALFAGALHSYDDIFPSGPSPAA